MKLKSVVLFASAMLPFGAAFAQNNAEPSGPQGTGWYGNSAPFAAFDRDGDGVISADEYPPRDARGELRAPGSANAPSAGATVSPQSDRDTDRMDTRDGRRARNPYDGFSADTNPPTPAP